MVRALRDQRLPRNQNFVVHASAFGARARRVHRLLAAVERDLRRATERTLAVREDGAELKLQFAEVHSHRVVHLALDELDLLRENPEIRALLEC